MHATIEYVATTPLRPIRQFAEVDVEQLAAIGRNERRRDLRVRERRLYASAEAARTTIDARLRALRAAAARPHGVENERVAEVELAFDGDLGTRRPVAPNQVLSQVEGSARVDVEHLDAGQPLQLGRAISQERERPVVRRNDAFHSEQLTGDRASQGSIVS